MSERWTGFRQTFSKCFFFLKNSMIDLTKTFIFWWSGVQEKHFFRIFYHKAIFCTFGAGSFISNHVARHFGYYENKLKKRTNDHERKIETLLNRLSVDLIRKICEPNISIKFFRFRGRRGSRMKTQVCFLIVLSPRILPLVAVFRTISLVHSYRRRGQSRFCWCTRRRRRRCQRRRRGHCWRRWGLGRGNWWHRGGCGFSLKKQLPLRLYLQKSTINLK